MIDKDLIFNSIVTEMNKLNSNWNRVDFTIWVSPSNQFAMPSQNNRYFDKNNNPIEEFWLIMPDMPIWNYLRNYFHESCQKRVSNFLEIKIDNKQLIYIKESWNQNVVDEFYKYLPKSKQKTHKPWYDLELLP